jgi:hypothetical protein
LRTKSCRPRVQLGEHVVEQQNRLFSGVAAKISRSASFRLIAAVRVCPCEP